MKTEIQKDSIVSPKAEIETTHYAYADFYGRKENLPHNVYYDDKWKSIEPKLNYDIDECEEGNDWYEEAPSDATLSCINLATPYLRRYYTNSYQWEGGFSSHIMLYGTMGAGSNGLWMNFISGDNGWQPLCITKSNKDTLIVPTSSFNDNALHGFEDLQLVKDTWDSATNDLTESLKTLPILKECHGIRIQALEFSLLVDTSAERPQPLEVTTSNKYDEFREFNFYTSNDGLDVVDTFRIPVPSCLRVWKNSQNNATITSESDYEEDISFHWEEGYHESDVVFKLSIKNNKLIISDVEIDTHWEADLFSPIDDWTPPHVIALTGVTYSILYPLYEFNHIYKIPLKNKNAGISLNNFLHHCSTLTLTGNSNEVFIIQHDDINNSVNENLDYNEEFDFWQHKYDDRFALTWSGYSNLIPKDLNSNWTITIKAYNELLDDGTYDNYIHFSSQNLYTKIDISKLMYCKHIVENESASVEMGDDRVKIDRMWITSWSINNISSSGETIAAEYIYSHDGVINSSSNPIKKIQIKGILKGGKDYYEHNL